jgi:fructose transport system permease protein
VKLSAPECGPVRSFNRRKPGRSAMSTTTSDSRTVEDVVAQSDATIASFDDHDNSFVKRIQNYLHTNPAAVPLIVLIGSLICFGVLLGGKLFSALR